MDFLKEQIWGSCIRHIYAYRKIIATKMAFVRFGGNDKLGETAVPGGYVCEKNTNFFT